MAAQGSKGVSHGMRTLGYFKGMKEVMGTCSMSATLGFTLSIVLIDIWIFLNYEGFNYENG